MTEQEYMAAVDAAVARWHQDRGGEPLTCQAFKDAVPAQCHANAEAYVTQHGGEIVRGFCVQHLQDWTMVWVMPHSIVRTDQALVDITLKVTDFVGLAFFPIEGDPDGFTDWAKLHPQESRPIARPH
jgi:hypothetical protein